MSLTIVEEIVPTGSDGLFSDAEMPPSAKDNSDTPKVVRCRECGDVIPGAKDGRTRYCDKHKRTKGDSAPTTARRGRKSEQLTRDLAQILAMVGAGVAMVERYDGLVILDRAEPTATALVSASETNPALRKVLEQLVTASSWSAVAMALVSLVGPILAHHRVLPLDERAVAEMFLSTQTVTNLYGT